MTYSLKASGRVRAISAQISSTMSRATWREGRVRLGQGSRSPSSQSAQAPGSQAQSSSGPLQVHERSSENWPHAGKEHSSWSLRDSGFRFFLGSMTPHLSEPRSASLRHKSCPARLSTLGGPPVSLQHLPARNSPSRTVHVLILRWRSRPPGRRKSCLLELRPAWDRERGGDEKGRVLGSGPAIVPGHGSPPSQGALDRRGQEHLRTLSAHGASGQGSCFTLLLTPPHAHQHGPKLHAAGELHAATEAQGLLQILFTGPGNTCGDGESRPCPGQAVRERGSSGHQPRAHWLLSTTHGAFPLPWGC